MKQRTPKPSRSPLWRRPSTLLIISLVAIAVGLIGQGVWIKAKAEFSQILLNRAFENALTQNRHNLENPVRQANKPWAWADIRPLARIEAPALRQSAIVLASVSGEALAFGPGHVGGTPLPGKPGTSVLAAHRDTHFKWVRHLKPGHRITVTGTDGSTSQYEVSRAWIAPYDQSGIDPDASGSRLALTTCYPFDATTPGPMRYIVETRMVIENHAASGGV